ncbi:MAG TPA: hypothetical protein DEO84_00605 [candidate division Zixibacteria bacterium]|nr:hypothetical protein [candidate division Zixibacteria bacterium]
MQNHITVLGDTPNDIAYSNGFIYVLNSTSADLQKIDPQSYSQVFDIPLTIGSNPYSVALDSSYAYVCCLVSGEVDRFDLNNGQPRGAIVIGGCPEGALIYGHHLYVAQTGFNPVDFSYGQGKMAIINLDSFTLEGEINVGKNPQAIFISPDHNLHIVCTGNYDNVNGTIYIFNPVSQTLDDSIAIGGQPAMGVVGTDGIAYLAAGGWVDHGYIYSYNSLTGQIIHGPSNPILSGLGVWSLAVDSLGFIYSCNYGSDTVTKLTPSGQIVATYGVGDGPQSMIILDDITNNVADNSAPQPTSCLLGNYPNPFNAETMIKYSLSPAARGASIAIFDITGRTLSRLNLGTQNDIGAVNWNGKDENGANCASGSYFARLEANSESGPISEKAIKLLLIR